MSPMLGWNCRHRRLKTWLSVVCLKMETSISSTYNLKCNQIEEWPYSHYRYKSSHLDSNPWVTFLMCQILFCQETAIKSISKHKQHWKMFLWFKQLPSESTGYNTFFSLRRSSTFPTCFFRQISVLQTFGHKFVIFCRNHMTFCT